MTDFIADVALVLTTANVVTALLGGVLSGYFLIGAIAADPTWISPKATARSVAMLVGTYTIAVGGVFYIGQSVAALVDGDPGWVRIAARYAIWALFGAAMAVGTWARITRNDMDKHDEARERAQHEIDDARNRD